MSQQQDSPETPVTFDEAFKALQHWRKHKKEYPCAGIPENVWLKVFQLENNGYTANELKRLLTLNSQQYDKKRNEFRQPSDHINTFATLDKAQNNPEPNSPVDFCEAAVKPDNQQNIPSLTQAADNTKKVISKLKSTDNKTENYLDMTTIIVECIRPDGQRLKIHTTSQSLNVVMQAFYQQGVSPS